MILREPVIVWAIAIEDAMLFLNLCYRRKPQSLQSIEALYSSHFGKDGGLQGFIDRLQEGLGLDGYISECQPEELGRKIKNENLNTLYYMMQEIGIAGAEIGNYVCAYPKEESTELIEWKKDKLHSIYRGLLQAQETLRLIISPKPQQDHQHEQEDNDIKDEAIGVPLPADMDTDRARKYIGKAIKLGWIKVEEGALKWLDIPGSEKRRGCQQRFAKFIVNIYAPSPLEDIIPITSCQKIFGIKQLSSKTHHVRNNTHRVTMGDKVDELFED